MNAPLSSDPLRVGDVCILVNLKISTWDNGKEVTITEPLRLLRTVNNVTKEPSVKQRYKASDGFWYSPENLQKKKPPREDLRIVRWDQCPWQPESIHV